MNAIWRFYSDDEHTWRWQRLAFDETVIEASAVGYEAYERCVSNAELHGYRYSPAKSTRPSPERRIKPVRRYVSTLPKEQTASVAGRDAPGEDID